MTERIQCGPQVIRDSREKGNQSLTAGTGNLELSTKWVQLEKHAGKKDQSHTKERKGKTFQAREWEEQIWATVVPFIPGEHVPRPSVDA